MSKGLRSLNLNWRRGFLYLRLEGKWEVAGGDDETCVHGIQSQQARQSACVQVNHSPALPAPGIVRVRCYISVPTLFPQGTTIPLRFA